MVKLVILFKRSTLSANFELGFQSNLALLRRMPGVQRIQQGDVFGGPAGEAAYHRMVEVFFSDRAALDAALRSPEGVSAGKDLMAFAGTGAELLFVDEQSAQTRPLTPDDLQAFLDAQDIEAEIVYPGAPTPTVPAAADALGVQEDQIVKSVVFLVDDRPFIVYANGTRRVDPRKLAVRLDVSRKKVKLADADQVLELTGYAVGTVPPVGLKTRMPSFLDPAIQEHALIYAGGGGISALLKLTPAELLRVTNAEIASMLRDGDADQPQEASTDSGEQRSEAGPAQA